MEITRELGEKVIAEVTQYTNVDINIMNLNGLIVASTNKARLNTTHLGAVQVIKTKTDVTLDDYNIEHYPGTKPGVNLPIMHQGKITGVVGVSGHPEDVLQTSGLIRASVELVLEHIHLQRQAHFKERQWNYWLQQLLHPGGFNEKKLKEEAIYTLHIQTDGWWRIIVIEGDDIQSAIDIIRQEVREQKITTLFILPFLNQEVIMTVPKTFERIDAFVHQLKHRLTIPFKVSIGDLEDGLAGIRTSYFQAKQALQFNKDGSKITYSEHWNVKRLITSIAKSEYNRLCLPYEHALRELGEEYIQTLDIYFNNNFSIKTTAKNLHIHRNTLLYRLNQIKDKTGLDPRQFEDAFLLKVILSWE